MEKLKVMELFSGIGAWSKALKNLNINHEVVFTADNDPYPVTAYNAIHKTNFTETDITKVNEKSLPDCDIICYSPPCQSFSQSGKQLGFEDTRGILFFDALRIIEEKKPKYAIMENVKGLTTKKFKKEFSIMLSELERAGYKNYLPDNKVLNALHLNFPQNRERVFIVSIRNDIQQDFKFPSKKPLTDSLLNYLENDTTLPILHNIYGGFKEDNARVFDTYSPTIRTSAGGGHIPSVVLNQQAKESIINNTYNNDFAAITGEKKAFKIAYKQNNKWYVLKDDYKQFITENKEKVITDDYYIIRQMSDLETFRLMGFNDTDYIRARDALNNTYYKGRNKSGTRLYKMAGNSIAVKMCEEIFKNLLIVNNQILKNTYKKI